MCCYSVCWWLTALSFNWTSHGIINLRQHLPVLYPAVDSWASVIFVCPVTLIPVSSCVESLWALSFLVPSDFLSICHFVFSFYLLSSPLSLPLGWSVMVHVPTSLCPSAPILHLPYLNLSGCYFYTVSLPLLSLSLLLGCYTQTPNQLSLLFFYFFFFPHLLFLTSLQAAIQVSCSSFFFPSLSYLCHITSAWLDTKPTAWTSSLQREKWNH